MKLAGKAAVGFYLLLSLLIFNTVNAQIGQPSSQAPLKSATESRASSVESRSILNINNAWLRVESSGVVGLMTYPMQFGGLLFSDYLIWVGKIKDGRSPEVRTGGGMYSIYRGTAAGAILSKGVAENPSSPDVRVYRIRPDYQTDDLRLDAAGYFDTTLAKVTPEMIEAVRRQYEMDWREWPSQKGAPFIDENLNGVQDPGEMPGLQGADEILWCVYNDLDESVCKSFYGGPSIGLEVQVTLWAYKNIPNLEDVIFKRYRLIYKGTSLTPADAVIDSLYLLQFADPDVGQEFDDLGGCDSLLGLSFAFDGGNSFYPDRTYERLGGPNPGIGHALLQGPLVLGQATDEGIFNFAAQKGVKNLPMTSFTIHITGGGDALVPPSLGKPTFWFWNVARGFQPYVEGISTRSWVNPDGTPTKFMAAGDPITRIGWIAGSGQSWHYPQGDGISSRLGDVRVYLNTGPFTMALGDTQEVVIAIIASPAPTAPENATYLKNRTKFLRGIYPNLGEYVAQFKKEPAGPEPSIPYDFTLDQNFPNPFNPSTTIRYAIPIDANVKLTIYDPLGREIRVLQGGRQSAGSYNIVWDSRDSQNRLVPSGVYLYRLTANYLQLTRKMIIVR